MNCESGETAISGGSQVIFEGAPNIVGWVDINKGGGPIGSPPTGWRGDGFEWNGAFAGTVVETWVICVS